MVSSLERRMRASTGAAPPVETAMSTGERSTMDGMIKLQSVGLSTTFTGIRQRRASCATRALSA